MAPVIISGSKDFSVRVIDVATSDGIAKSAKTRVRRYQHLLFAGWKTNS
ncbi:MAG: hypothetical protein U0936_12540 [Planctomycetaceae bacterium]